jgi:glycerol-3-phosphate dehydrogenase
VVSIYGGKLTSYRATAEKLLRRIKTVLPETMPVADTRSLEIPNID